MGIQDDQPMFEFFTSRCRDCRHKHDGDCRFTQGECCDDTTCCVRVHDGDPPKSR